jgi:hypothetical protein
MEVGMTAQLPLPFPVAFCAECDGAGLHEFACPWLRGILRNTLGPHLFERWLGRGVVTRAEVVS